MIKVLVYGAKGWIGSQFTDLLNSRNIVWCKAEGRADDSGAVKNEIMSNGVTHVVSFIGRTHGTHEGKTIPTIDYLELDGKLEENVRDNLLAPTVLAKICADIGVHFTYLGTGCIFDYDGNEDSAFGDDALPNFKGSSYSTVKGNTDRIMHLFNNTALNLRIRMPIVGYDCPRNFITKIKSYAKICSIPNSMTVLPELLPVALDLMESRVTGTYNFTNPGVITHNEILQLYKEKVEPDFTWENFTVEEQNEILASKRSNNRLDTTKLESVAAVRPIKDAIADLLDDYVVALSLDKVEANNLPDRASTHVLVTGGCGFIGSNFVNHLHTTTNNVRITNLDAMYYCASHSNLKHEVRTSPRYSFVQGNLRSYDLLIHLMKTNKFTHVVHFAAQSHVQSSFDDSLTYTMDNIVGTHNLLEAARLHCGSLSRFVHVSTDEVYGESMLDVNEQHKTEHSILCPTNPYAATKAGAELIAQSYNHSFGMPIIISRGNNVYGPSQHEEKLVPRFIKLLRENKKLTIQGDGSCVRAFLHASDTAKAFKCILEKGKVGEIYNIGCDDGMEYTVLEVAEKILALVKPGESLEDWVTYVEDRPFNDKRYYISNKKLKELGWEVSVSFNEGLAQLV